MPSFTCIGDLGVLAQKRVPRRCHDYADSGSWTESRYRANGEDFQRIKLRERVAVNMQNRSLVDLDHLTPVGPWAHWAVAAGQDLPEPDEGPRSVNLGLVLEAAILGLGKGVGWRVAGKTPATFPQEKGQ